MLTNPKLPRALQAAGKFVVKGAKKVAGTASDLYHVGKGFVLQGADTVGSLAKLAYAVNPVTLTTQALLQATEFIQDPVSYSAKVKAGLQAGLDTAASIAGCFEISLVTGQLIVKPQVAAYFVHTRIIDIRKTVFELNVAYNAVSSAVKKLAGRGESLECLEALKESEPFRMRNICVNCIKILDYYRSKPI